MKRTLLATAERQIEILRRALEEITEKHPALTSTHELQDIAREALKKAGNDAQG